MSCRDCPQIACLGFVTRPRVVCGLACAVKTPQSVPYRRIVLSHPPRAALAEAAFPTPVSKSGAVVASAFHSRRTEERRRRDTEIKKRDKSRVGIKVCLSPRRPVSAALISPTVASTDGRPLFVRALRAVLSRARECLHAHSLSPCAHYLSSGFPVQFPPPECTGSTPETRLVLNNKMISVPTGREGSFKNARKSQFEEAIFRNEDERSAYFAIREAFAYDDA